MVIALALFHVLRSVGRERLRVSTGLRGNGMCFTMPLLKQVPHDAFSVVEDLEYGIRIGNAGHRVWYVAEAHVLGEMVSGEQASRSQRTRWEAGRFAIARQHGAKLLRDGFAKRSRLLLDLAMDVLVPPLTYLIGSAFLGFVVSAAVSWWAMTAGVPPFAWVPWAASMFFVTCYVLRGVVVANVGWAGVGALMWAPVYIIWKVALAVKQSRQRKDEWVRTAREKAP
jgi:cellulose synthase/poly-beta-1,6-N-acetylglucosamine synthase-like glycosyltransferase